MLFLDRAWERFDDDGRLRHREDRERLTRLVGEFVAYCRELPARGSAEVGELSTNRSEVKHVG